MRFFILTLSCVMLFGFQSMSLFADDSSDIKTIRERLMADYLKQPASLALKYVSALGPDGSWPDIDYKNQSRNIWLPAEHFSRLVVMAVAYRTQKNKAFEKPDMLEGIQRGLRHWFALKLKASNWWFNTIGVPQKAMRILVLMDADLAPDIRQGLLDILPDPAHVPSTVATGENLVWHASEQLVRGVMKPDTKDIAEAIGYLQKDIRVSTDEGIQPDSSFHQHGAQLYNGGYGFGFMHDTSYYAALLAGTKWAFSKNSLDILAFYLLEGQRRMFRGLWFDNNARGREPSRPKNSATAVNMIDDVGRLAALVPAKAGELSTLQQVLLDSKKRAADKNDDTEALPSSAWAGNAAFWRSDFMTHNQSGWYASVKMVSNRTVGTEMVNSENLKGFWLPFGATYFVRRGNEYADIWAVWDFARIPGVTAPHRIAPISAKFSQGEDFVGVVSNGRYGLAAMRQDKLDTKARKAWFFFDDGVIALGSGIESGDSEATGTTINQSLLHATVVVDGKLVSGVGEQKIDNGRWVLHDSIAYIVPANSNLWLKTGPATGSWKSINGDNSPDPLVKDLFTLWIDHGVKPHGASYAYTVLPGANATLAESWSQRAPVRVVTNTPDLQVVNDERTNTWAIVFNESGTANLNAGQKLSSDKACLVLLSQNGSNLTVCVSDPRQGKGTVNLVLEKQGTKQRLSLALPEGDGKEGSSVSGHF